MERRKFLAGLGSLAAGGAAVIGSGAFTSVNARRTLTLETTDDANAYLQMQPSSSPNGSYAETTGTNEITVTLDRLNKNATTSIGQIVTVTNTGTQPVLVYAPWQDSGGSISPITDRVSADADEDGDREFAKPGENGDTDDGVKNDIYVDLVTPRGGGKSLTGIYGVFEPGDSYFDDMTVGVGNSIDVGVFVRTKNPPNLDARFTLAADADSV